MYNIMRFLRKLFASITIMFIPHNPSRCFSIKIPYILIVALIGLSAWGGTYTYTSYKASFELPDVKLKLAYYEEQFRDIQSTIASLQMADKQFKKLFAVDSKEDILDNMHKSDMGALDMDVLRRQINRTIDEVGEIKDYLSLQSDLYRSTPMGYPVDKHWVSSSYGRRKHPITGKRDYHTGIDLSATPGSDIMATADGIVSFSSRSGANGNLVAIEHGFGYSTYYAHNKKNLVKVGQIIKRGEVIALVGSTGSSTGPHVHYEISKEGNNVNPKRYLKGGTF